MFPSNLQRMAGEATRLLAAIAAGLQERVGGQVALEVVQELAAGGRQLELAQCLSAEQVDRSGIWQAAGGGGATSTAAFLRNETGETAGWASRRIRLGRVLEDSLPETRRVWGEGAIGMDKATVIAAAVDGLDADSTGKAEAILAEAAPVATRKDLITMGDRIRTLTEPEDAEQKARADFIRQGVTLSETLGGCRLSGWLNTEAGAIVKNALEQFTAKPAPAADGEPTPSPKLRRALGLIEMAKQALGHQTCERDNTARPTVIVTLPLDVLKHQLGVGDIEGGDTMPASAVRRLACDADIIPMIFGSDGAVLDAGRSRRTISPHQRAALAVRDRHCVFPGCDRPPSWCQGHHIREWVRDHGPTDLKNLILLCHHHHHLVHEGGWTITGQAGPTLRFQPPTVTRPQTNQIRRT